jgi:hypothetical protein
MVAVWPVREIGVQKNWKCASVETPEVLKPEESKEWDTMMSPEGYVDLKIY